ncbi:MAG: Holliday junction branch migration DNA helicase RuvB, partial [Candidatus Adiutrix sp.]|nr:Holliday junction branch migration DNA helicase RuvB [Candidatus Adiutrix sp.]
MTTRDLLAPQAAADPPEAALEKALRPRSLAEFQGQPALKEKLVSGNIRFHDSSKKLADLYRVINIPGFGNIV